MMLNFRGDSTSRIQPDCSQCRRFNLIPTLHSRLMALATGDTGAGKQIYTRAQAVDLHASTKFHLCGEGGSLTGLHVDTPVAGTWGTVVQGDKTWLVYSSGGRSELAKHGPSWMPDNPSDVKMVMLGPNMTIVMAPRGSDGPGGPGGPCIHGALTLTKCLMVGGMFLDDLCLLDWIRDLIWIISNPLATNEPVPLEFFDVWPILKGLLIDNPERYGTTPLELQTELENFDRQLRGLLSCTCGGTCKGDCPCLSSISLDGKCSPWCHDGRRVRKCCRAKR